MKARKYGVLIASSCFSEKKLQDLRCPENDVDGLNKVLMAKDRGAFTETIVLKNKPHHKVLIAIEKALKKAAKNDLVFIYYSGHGKLNEAGKLHLACKNTELKTLGSTSLPMSTIKELVDVATSTKIVIVLDCCFAGAAGGVFAKSSVDDQLNVASSGRGIYVLSACTSIQVAQEKEGDRYGVFTKHMIEGLRTGRADIDNDGWISVQDLNRYVHDQVLTESPQEPGSWGFRARGIVRLARSKSVSWKERSEKIRSELLLLAREKRLPNSILTKALKLTEQRLEDLPVKLQPYAALLEKLSTGKEPVDSFIDEWIKLDKGPPDWKWLKFALLAVMFLFLIFGGGWFLKEFTKNNPDAALRKELASLKTKAASLGEKVANAQTITDLAAFEQQLDDIIERLERIKDPVKKIGASSSERLNDILIKAKTLKRQASESGDEILSGKQKIIAAIKGLEVKTDNLKASISGTMSDTEIQALNQKIQHLIQEIQKLQQQAQAADVQEKMVSLTHKAQGLLILLHERSNQLKTVKLLVNTEPENARVQVLDIKPKFRPGMSLKPGQYHLKVSADGYKSRLQLIDLQPGREKPISIVLKKKSPHVPTPPGAGDIVNTIGMQFVKIPAGSFIMGSPKKEEGHESHESQHKVTISRPFYLQTTEVTLRQWEQLMDKNNSNHGDCPECPVVMVSWHEAKRFIDKLNKKEKVTSYRLPSESEWEYACRAGTKTPFSTGPCITSSQANYDARKPLRTCPKGIFRQETIPVGSLHHPNDLGLHDMHGNVAEWCADRYGKYSSQPVTDPRGPDSGAYRVIRGGSCYKKAVEVRSAYRGYLTPDFPGSEIGFRVARELQ